MQYKSKELPAAEGVKPIYEFLLWNNCNNNCGFCWQKANKDKFPGKFLSGDKKATSINRVYHFINSNKMETGAHVLLMGGEIFDPLHFDRYVVRDRFLSLVALIANKMFKKEIDLLYINTNLLYSNLFVLTVFLNVFVQKGLIKRIRFTTSYDLQYRFASETDRLRMLGNAKEIRAMYPKLHMVANVIMTDYVCRELMKPGELEKVQKDLKGISLNFIPYIILHEEQAATRSEIQKFLLFLEQREPGYLRRYLDAMCFNQPRHILEFNGRDLKDASSANSECGHNVNFRRVYKDSNRCFICDCQELVKVVEGE